MDLRGRRLGLKTPGMEVGSEIGLGFGEPGGTHAHQTFPGIFSPVPTKYLIEIRYLILKENWFQFFGSN